MKSNTFNMWPATILAHEVGEGVIGMRQGNWKRQRLDIRIQSKELQLREVQNKVAP